MMIEHDTWGEVEGVSQEKGCTDAWRYKGAFYYEHHGWREKKVEVWVWMEVAPAFYDDASYGALDPGSWPKAYRCAKNQRLRYVERYDLPEEWYRQWQETPVPKSMGISQFIQRFKKPCLIVERRVKAGSKKPCFIVERGEA